MKYAFALALLFSVQAGAVAAAPKDFVPARAVATGGGRSAGSGNEAIFLNPATLGATHRYVIQMDYAISSGATGLAGGDGLVVSIVDSISNPLFPSGFALRFMGIAAGAGVVDGTTQDFATAFPVGSGILLGTHITRMSYRLDEKDYTTITGDLGLMLKFDPINIGIVGFNLIKVDAPDVQRGFSVGTAFTDDYNYRLAVDWRWEGGVNGLVRSWSIGGEWVMGGVLPLRFGYDSDELRGRQFMAFGSGIVLFPLGFDVSWRKDFVTGESLWAFALKMYAN